MCHTGKERFANILENKQNKTKMGRGKQAWHESYTKRFVFYILCVFFFVNIVFFFSSLLLGLFRYTKACIYLFIV